MFLLSFIFAIVVLGIEYVHGIYCLFISVIPLEIQLSSRKDMDSITRFNPLFAQVSRQDRIQRNMSIFRGTRLYHCLCCCFLRRIVDKLWKLHFHNWRLYAPFLQHKWTMIPEKIRELILWTLSEKCKNGRWI